jgi:hypothetical protein
MYDKKLLATYVSDKKEKSKQTKLDKKLRRQSVDPSSFDFGGEDDVEFYKLFK